MTKEEAYKIVYEDLLTIPHFRGEDIDTRQADFFWIRGISAVMRRIAQNVSDDTEKEFNELFHRNLEASRLKYEGPGVSETRPATEFNLSTLNNDESDEYTF